ncbi:hypothetical protein ACFY9A_39430 [Streptomyces rubradiris]|uniref:hypothetical protein n=1 Tax=Streptomyces rubradiris TaxID=285531 RepID=UPI0036F1866E
MLATVRVPPVPGLLTPVSTDDDSTGALPTSVVAFVLAACCLVAVFVSKAGARRLFPAASSVLIGAGGAYTYTAMAWNGPKLRAAVEKTTGEVDGSTGFDADPLTTALRRTASGGSSSGRLTVTHGENGYESTAAGVDSLTACT